MSQPLVEISHLYKSYHRGSQVLPVLEDISLTIGAGEFGALMGPSGSGKTTLLNLIAGLDRFDRGHLSVGGVELSELSESPVTELDGWSRIKKGTEKAPCWPRTRCG